MILLRSLSIAIVISISHHFMDEPASLQQALQAGVSKLLLPAVRADKFDAVLSLSARYPQVYAALGLHPLYIAHHQAEDIQTLATYLSQNTGKVVALGEMGLDLYMAEPMFLQQQQLLKQQLRLAEQASLPVVLHSRRSHDQLAALLRQMKCSTGGVVHGFSGSLSQAQVFIKLGLAIGVGGTITYPRAKKTRDVVAQLPLGSLLLETDAPDMPLSGYQGQANRPERIAEVFATLCQLRREPAQQIAEVLYQNTLRVFPAMGRSV
jgi:TatD DNase family protein